MRTVYLLCALDWDGEDPISIHRSRDTARAKAERLYEEYWEKAFAEGRQRVKGFKAAWRVPGDPVSQPAGEWTYAGFNVHEMQVED